MMLDDGTDGCYFNASEKLVNSFNDRDDDLERVAINDIVVQHFWDAVLLFKTLLHHQQVRFIFFPLSPPHRQPLVKIIDSQEDKN